MYAGIRFGIASLACGNAYCCWIETGGAVPKKAWLRFLVNVGRAHAHGSIGYGAAVWLHEL